MDEIRLVERRTLLDAEGVATRIGELAAGIAEHARSNPIGLVGIQTGGVYLAERICGRLEEMGIERPPQGVLDITLYRDDIFL
ncbi:MAG: bifunctional pyr operon transcriptional regulator/uracil phosphoribosyltransferase, partial [Deltaproteobacteria bacterium]|nr:bifunctional pyr operon transcriptional regulator/uracil phosphoribosyltransferase [Deltaproteobacteria bacterium]